MATYSFNLAFKISALLKDCTLDNQTQIATMTTKIGKDAKHQIYSLKHVVLYSSKALVTAVAQHRYAWLRETTL